LLVFDAAVNDGPGDAAVWLQTACGAHADGQIGPLTKAAVAATWKAHGGAALCGEFMARRLVYMAALPTWRTFALGWARRLCALEFEAVRMGITRT